MVCENLDTNVTIYSDQKLSVSELFNMWREIIFSNNGDMWARLEVYCESTKAIALWVNW